MKIALLLVACATAMATPLAAAPGKSEATVTVRTYDYAGATGGDLAAARGEVEQIFRSASIAVRWIDCRVPGRTGGEPCTEALAPGRDLMLRLVERTPAADAGPGRIAPLGESLVDREERGGVLMTVDVFPIRAIAGRTSTGAAVLLGRAIAHEIGHLLLGSGEHARLGLMRALWSHDELRGAKPASWGFSSREAAQMRQTLRGRSRTAD
jgi:hypothetical protein